MKFRVPKPELPGFQLTPMLDVVFLLLCFFVTTSVYSQWENEVEIQLPSADSSVVPNRLPGEIIVNVAKDGAIRVNGRTLTPEELARSAVVKDTLNTFEVRNAFLGSSKDLMTFLQEREDALSSEEERLTLFCRLAVEFDEDFRITEDYREAGDFLYPLIYPR